MSTVLQTIYEPTEAIVYTDPTMDANEDYPVDVGPAVLPEIWAPRLYGKGLNMLEVGSSGKIALTASDKRALDVDVTESDGQDTTRLRLPGAAGNMTIGTADADIIKLEPTFRFLDDTMATGLVFNAETVTTTAAGPMTTTAAYMDTTVTQAATLTAETVTQTATGGAISLSAFEDIVLTSGGNPTVTVKNDRIIIKGDIDIDGVVNSTAVQSLQTLQVTDNYIEVADGLEHEVLNGGEGSQNGLRVNTVPNGSTMADGDAVDTYLKKFKDGSGAPAFYTDGAFDQVKYAAANQILGKGILFNVNGGSSVGGYKTLESRNTESYWDVLGGAMQISRVVPSATDNLVHKLSMALRVTNGGELEIVKHKVPMTMTAGKYQEGTPEPAKVVARFGHMVAAA